jgi:DNA-directed RNA polymerase subunit L
MGCTSLILAPRRLRQEDHGFKNSLSETLSKKKKEKEKIYIPS